MGRVMFFLLRMAFWLGVVCVLLPSGGSHSGANDPQINVTQAITLASAAMSDARGFCDRQPQACAVGGKVATALGHKAVAGARTLYGFVSARLSETGSDESGAGNATSQVADNTGSIASLGHNGAGVAPASTRNMGTLTPADLRPSWHAPVPLPPRREARTSRHAA